MCDLEDDVKYVIQLNDLPFEILERILQCDNVTHLELCRFSKTCRTFNCITSRNKLWEKKFAQWWPKLSKVYAVSKFDDDTEVYWKQEFQVRHMFSKELKQKLEDMSETLYSCENSVKYIFRDFQGLVEGHKMALHFLIDELECKLFDGCSNRNLTEKYYSERLLRFARQLHFSSNLRFFLNQPENFQSPEIGASLISLYCQPTATMTVEDISKALDDIAYSVKKEIFDICQNHPVLSEDLIPPCRPLEKSRWKPADCRIILNCLNSVLFHSLCYKTLSKNSICDSSVYIDKVLINKYGFPTTVSIIYMALSHRLGVRCFATNSDSIYILKWQEHPDLNDDLNSYSYINMNMKGRFVSAADCFSDGDTSIPQIRLKSKSPKEIMLSVCKHLTETYRTYDTLEDDLVVRSSALELYTLFEPTSMEHKLLLVQIYVQLKFKLHQASGILQQITSSLDRFTGSTVAQYLAHVESLIAYEALDVPQEKMTVKYRRNYPKVSFAVGMVMKHKKYNYICVIYGWDSKCCADEIWIARMGVRKLLLKDKQPFYNVLVDDGTCRYAAEENLKPYHFPRSVSNYNVGRYFREFCIDHYVPNNQLEQQYPEDSAARDEMLRNSACAKFGFDEDPV